MTRSKISSKLTLSTLLASAAIVTILAGPAAAEYPFDYQRGHDDNFMRVAVPPVYLAGFILDWAIYRPVHAIMRVTTGGHEHHINRYSNDRTGTRVHNIIHGDGERIDAGTQIVDARLY